MVYAVLAIAALIVGLICSILIVIDAFQDEIWKGILSLICWPYVLYYSIFEFDHDNKWLIVLMALGGNAIASGLWGLAFRH